VNATLTERRDPTQNGKSFYLLIGSEFQTGLFNLQDPIEQITSAINQSFGIRCPVSIAVNNRADSWQTFDYEDSCLLPDFDQLNEAAYCGKCSKTKDFTLFTNLNSTLDYRYLCLAYKVSTKPFTALNFDLVDPLFGTLSLYSAPFIIIADNNWHYECIDMYQAYLDSEPTAIYSANKLKLFKVWINSGNSNLRVDTVSVRKNLPVGISLDNVENSLHDKRRVFPPFQFLPKSLQVQKPTSSKIEFSFQPTNCSYNLPALTLVSSSSNSQSEMILVSAASPPVTGHFDIEWNGQKLLQVPANISEYDLKLLLESLPEFGQAYVERSKNCSGYKWRVRWEKGGEKLPLTVSNTNLSGNSVTISVKKFAQGGVNFRGVKGKKRLIFI